MKLQCAFHLPWTRSRSFSSLVFFPSFYRCTVGDVSVSLHFCSVSHLLSLFSPLSALFFLPPAAAFLHSHSSVITCESSSSLHSPDLPLNLSTLSFFHFRTPTSALHHSQPTFPGFYPPMIYSVGCFFLSFCLHPFFLSSFMSS